MQGTRKIGCPAHVVVKHYTLFPEYAIHSDDIEWKSKYNLRLLKEQTLKKLQNEIESGYVKQTTRYWLSLPTLEAHEKTHPQAAVFSQVNPAVPQMIAELVADDITEIDDAKKALRHRINHYLCKDSPLDPNDRTYFQTHDDLRNHIYREKHALQHSKYGQKNLRQKVQNWKKTHPDANFFFCPCCIDSDCNSTAAEGKKEGEVHAEISALECCFPDTIVYLCDFHR